MVSCKLFAVLCISSIFGGASSGNILVLSFFSTKSHKLTYMPIMEELARRGHSITMLTPIRPLSLQPIPNITEHLLIDWEEIEKLIMDDFNPYDSKQHKRSSNPHFTVSEGILNLCRRSFDLPVVQQLIQDRPQFDVIFLNPMFNECLLGIVHLLGAPVVLWSPIGATSYFAGFVGGHFPTSFNPNLFVDYPTEMTFLQRFYNFGYNVLFESVVRWQHEPHMEAIYRDALKNPKVPSTREILTNQTALALCNSHFSLHKPKPLLPDIVDVGGIHSRPAKPLEQSLEQFVSGGEHGFIYFSMGSALRGSNMPDDKRKIFLNVFSRLKQRVLWKWETEQMEEPVSKNVKLVKWLPQQDLLGHPNIRMFITHCGGGSTEEAIYHGVPLLGFPMFGDQTTNAKLARDHGIILDMDWNDITEESLMNAVQEVLNNSSYRENVKKLSAIYKDQPDKPLDRAVYWIEYVIRHKGAYHLRSVSRNLNFFQFHSYDVVLSYFAVIGGVLYVVYKVLRMIVGNLLSLIGISNRKKVSSKKEN